MRFMIIASSFLVSRVMDADPIASTRLISRLRIDAYWHDKFTATELQRSVRMTVTGRLAGKMPGDNLNGKRMHDAAAKRRFKMGDQGGEGHLGL
jgi:hypothetical protein